MSLKIIHKKNGKKEISIEDLPSNTCFRISQNWMDQDDTLDDCPDGSCFLKTKDTDYGWNPSLVKTKGFPRYLCLCFDTGGLIALNKHTPVIPIKAELHLD